MDLLLELKASGLSYFSYENLELNNGGDASLTFVKLLDETN